MLHVTTIYASHIEKAVLGHCTRSKIEAKSSNGQMMYNFSVTSEITTNFERQIPNETALVVDIGLLENLDKLDFPR